MRLALAQVDPVVGDLEGNRELILAADRGGAGRGRRPRRPPRARGDRLSAGGSAPPARLRAGGPRVARRDRGRSGRASSRSSARRSSTATSTTRARSARDGEVRGITREAAPPELRRLRREAVLRARATSSTLVEVAGTRVGITICEDMWIPGPPTTELAAAGAELVVNLSASPFHVGREREREEIFRARARENGVRSRSATPSAGRTSSSSTGTRSSSSATARSSRGRRASRRRCSSSTSSGPRRRPLAPIEDDLEQMRRALVLGLRDYVSRTASGTSSSASRAGSTPP